MSVSTVTHLNFQGQARAALDFYHRVFGGDRVAVTYREAGQGPRAQDGEHVLWGQVAASNGFRVMAHDVAAGVPWHPGENAFFVSLRADTAEAIAAHWSGLSEGATIVQPLAPSDWSPLYGMLRDRFDVVWVLDVAVPHAG